MSKTERDARRNKTLCISNAMLISDTLKVRNAIEEL
jgi:hypothetical protein